MPERAPDSQRGGRVQDVSAQFRAAWAQMRDPSTATPELLPSRLARASAQVLPVDGAGLSLFNGTFRVPLGASSEEAGLAERLQFTLGEGPCMDAAARGRTLALGSADLEQRWPQYSAELFARTPYRGVMTVPLEMTEDSRGALDLFLEDQERLASLSLVDASTVADRIVEALELASSLGGTPTAPVGDLELPRWLLAPPARRRETVWIAMGMVMSCHNLGGEDALAILRGHAFGNRTDVDDVADRMLRGELSAETLAP